MITPENDDSYIVVSYKSIIPCEECGKIGDIWTIEPTEEISPIGERYTSECSKSKLACYFLARFYGYGYYKSSLVPYEIMDKETFYEKFIKDKIKYYNL